MYRTALALAAALCVTACATDGVYHGGGYAYDGFYDDHYGPIYDGYWGDGDVFYYRSGRRGSYLRDDDHHFRRDINGISGGYHAMHVMGPRPGGHRDRH